jgi:hypothetical protein
MTSHVWNTSLKSAELPLQQFPLLFFSLPPSPSPNVYIAFWRHSALSMCVLEHCATVWKRKLEQQIVTGFCTLTAIVSTTASSARRMWMHFPGCLLLYKDLILYGNIWKTEYGSMFFFSIVPANVCIYILLYSADREVAASVRRMHIFLNR